MLCVRGRQGDRGAAGGQAAESAAERRKGEARAASTMGGYTSSDDETLGSAGPNVGGQASTPPEFRFLAAGRRSLKEYLLGTAGSNNTNSNSVGSSEAAIRPLSPPALVGGGDGGTASVVAASASFVSSSFERIGACVRACWGGGR